LHGELNVAECHENEFADQLVEEQDVVPIFVTDNIAEVFRSPIYNEYDHDYDANFLEQPIVCSLSGNVCFHQTYESKFHTCYSYDITHKESSEST
jgi:hypothetical protein